MNKRLKKLISILIAAMMISAILPTAALAADWSPTDTITITVRAYDQNTGAVYNLGTDTVTKGDKNIQSDAYTIPSITKFTGNSYGTVTKVVGNWYFPSGDRQVGSVVNWSCNSDTATMTYWVTNWCTGSGSGSGSNANETVDYGNSGKKSWTETIVYHSNYPNGTDYQYSVTYHIKSYSDIANYNLKTVTGCGFSEPDGYAMRDRVWDTAKDGNGANYANGGNYPFKQSDANKTIHLYAQWTPTGGTPVTTVTVTYRDGDNTYATVSALSGDIVTAIDCTNTREGYTFKGWDTSSDAATAVYLPGAGFAVTDDMTLYAVWEKNNVNPPAHECVDENGDGYCDDENCRMCLHDHDGDGYCTVDDCQHPHEGDDACCPKPGAGDSTGKVSEPGMDKKAEGKESIGTVKPGQKIGFTLHSTVPQKLAELAVYENETWQLKGEYKLVFHDTLSSNLTLDASTIAVKIGNANLNARYYTVATEGIGTGTFTVTVDLVAAFNEGHYFTWEEMGAAPVVVSYSATVDENAADGDEVKNEAYVNNSATDAVVGEVDIPYIPDTPSTGGTGTVLFTVSGVGLMSAAAILLLLRRKQTCD